MNIIYQLPSSFGDDILNDLDVLFFLITKSLFLQS